MERKKQLLVFALIAAFFSVLQPSKRYNHVALSPGLHTRFCGWLHGLAATDIFSQLTDQSSDSPGLFKMTPVEYLQGMQSLVVNRLKYES